MTVRSRLLLAATPLAVALVLLSAGALGSISFLGATTRSILADNYRSVLAAQRMKEAIERVDDDAYFQATGHPEGGEGSLEQQVRVFEAELAVQEGNITEPGEAELTAAVRGVWEDFQGLLHACLARPAGPAAQGCYFAELRPRFHEIKRGAEAILVLNQDAMALKSERARHEAERVRGRLLAASLLALLLGFALTWTLATRALRPLEALGEAVEQFGRGDFAVRVPPRGGAEFAQLAASFNAMADRIEEYRRSSLGEMLQAQLAAQATLESLSDPVLVLAADGGVLQLNRAAEELFAPSERSAPAVARLAPALRAAVEAMASHVSSGKGPFVPRSFDEAFPVERPEGERVFLPRAAPIYEEGGGVVGATVVLQDVTRLRRFEQLRDDLVSTAAHQFRTPLTSLRMAIHLCLEGSAGPLSDKQQDLLYAAREECERLQEIVDELLDLAQLQSGRIELELEETTPRALVDEAMQTFQPAARSRGIELVAEPLLEEEALRVDASRIRLVFANLLENALRHTPSGGRIAVRACEEGERVRFEVVDSGPGIPEAERGRIFEKFYRGTTGGGAGLGLSIARDVVRSHGGEIGVESAPERGSTFWFTLPRRAPGQSP
jgi:signal transduction histidine kinase